VLKLKQAYIVYPGLGKTTLSKKRTDIADIEGKIFRDASLAPYIGKSEYPNYRGQKVVAINPEYPENLYTYCRGELGAGKTLVSVPKQETYDLIRVLGIEDYAFIMPSRERLAQLEADYNGRGDDAEYIRDCVGERYEAVLKYAASVGKEVIFVGPGEYLEQVLS